MNKREVSDVDMNELVEAILAPEASKSYIRVLSDDERRFIETEAFGYLLHLHDLGSIDDIILERVLSVSLQMSLFIKKIVNKPMIDEIVNYLIFAESANLSMKDILDMITISNNEFDFTEEIN